MLSSNTSETAPPVADLAALAEDHYFGANPAPKELASHEAQAREFIAFHQAAQRRVVLVTSGGTTVPLERQTVRFIDNFSAGTRGAVGCVALFLDILNQSVLT
jgi:phosphopantothenate---cysteine ligase (ATP)